MPAYRDTATRMAAARRRLGLEPGRFIVLHAAGLAPRAGADTAIQGLAMLRARWGADAWLIVIAGESRGDAPQLARLRHVAADLGVKAQVCFAAPAGHDGLGERLNDYYGAANVVASTPWYAPCGFTPAMAMAHARPVVGTRVRGMEGLVVDGVTGFLVPARDAEALAERLDRLYRRPARAQAMGLAGRRHLRASRSHVAAGYAHVLLGRAGSGETEQPAPCSGLGKAE
ncbi:glycosyltransferase [Massilia sp. ST3]|uniref:glycosyltransferase n=1 Tax=Massilia sp. ST3 TaxID=2824903 RepID=UPI001B816C33|nr:glycosyltransferase [Massilia sp. ST3]MBQ5946972.1 glycosyltransferase [Massilia sp. ST3]